MRVWANLSFLVLLACGPKRFQAAKPEAPHAELELEVAYNVALRREDVMTQELLIDGRAVFVPEPGDRARAWSRTLRLSPGSHQISFHAYVEHPDLTLNFVRPQVPGCDVMHTTVGVFDDCVYMTQARPQSEWIWQTVAECRAEQWVEARAGSALRVTFRFAPCESQVALAGGPARFDSERR